MRSSRRISYISFTLTLVASISLLVAGFFLPPTGVIDNSVIAAVGELAAFAAIGQIPHLFYIVRQGGSVKIGKGDMSVEIQGDDN